MNFTYDNKSDDERYILKGSRSSSNEDVVHGLGNYYFSAMNKNKDKLAQIDVQSGRKQYYNEIKTDTVRIAIEMRKRGIQENDLVAVCSELHADVFKPLISSYFLGARTICFEPGLSLEETVYLLDLTKPKMIFCSESGIVLMEKAMKNKNFSPIIVVFGASTVYASFNEFLRYDLQECGFLPVEPKNLRNTAVMFFSSGTTGRPKAICLSHYSFLLQTTNLNTNSNEAAILLCYSCPYWISAHCLLLKIFSTGSIQIIPKPFTEHGLLVTIQNYKVSVCFLTPSYIQRLIKEFNGKIPPYNFSSLKSVMFGGSAITKEQVDKCHEMFPGVKINNIYGMTETSGVITQFSFPEDEELMKKKPTSCGKVRSGNEIKIIDENGNNLPLKSRGELCVKTHALMNGYYAQNGFVSDFLDEKGWYRTGDIGYIDEDYCVFIIDRNKEMLKYQNYQISPLDIEDAIRMHPSVDRVAVFGIPDPLDGDHATAAVVLRNKSSISESDLLKYANDKLDDKRKIRGGMHFVESIPMTPSGKVKKRQLRELFFNKN